MHLEDRILIIFLEVLLSYIVGGVRERLFLPTLLYLQCTLLPT